jgi:hypothetical protein
MARRKLQPIHGATNGIPPVIRALRREVAINIDGTVYNICFDYNVLCELETLLGTDQIRDIYKQMGEGKLPPFAYTRACLYACLKHAGAAYTLEEVGSFMHYGSLAAINAALFAAQRASLSDDAAEEEENPTIAAAAQ